MNQTKCIPGPFRYPSGTGLRIHDLLRYLGEIRGFKRIHQQIESSIDQALKSKNPYMVFLVGEWGFGKTSVFETVLREEAGKRRVLPILVPASTIFNYIEHFITTERSIVFSKTNPQILMAAIIAAIKEAGIPPSGKPDLEEILEEIRRKLEYPATMKHATEYLQESIAIINKVAMKYGFKSIAIFIDEFENISSKIKKMRTGSENDAKIVEITLSGLVDISNGYIKELNEPIKYIFILTVTPNIWNSIKRIPWMEDIIGRIREGRASEVKLKPLYIPDRYEFAIGILKYSYKVSDDTIVKEIFPDTSYLNPVLIASMGIPAFIQTILSKILELRIQRQESCPPDTTQPITEPLEYMEILEDVSIEMFGVSTPVINRELYNILIDEVRMYARAAMTGGIIRPEKFEKLFIMSLISNVIYKDKLLEEIGEDYENYIYELNLVASIRGSKLRAYNISRFIFRGKALLVDGPDKVERLVNELVNDRTIKRILQTEVGLKSDEEINDAITSLVNTMMYIDSRGRIILVNPDVNQVIDYMSAAIPYEIESISLEVLAERIEEIISNLFRETLGTIYFINPRLIKLVYLSLELYYLDFLIDRISRLDYWRRTLKFTEENMCAYMLSILALLSRNGINIEHAYIRKLLESRSENIYLINGAGIFINNSYHLVNFALILSRRRLSEDDIRIYIDRINDNIHDHEEHPHFILIISSDYEPSLKEEKLSIFESSLLTRIIIKQVPGVVPEIKLISLGLKVMDEIRDTRDQQRVISRAFYAYGGEGTKERELLEEKGIDILRAEAVLDELSEGMGLRYNDIINELRREPSMILEEPKRDLRLTGFGLSVFSSIDLLKAVKYYISYPEPAGTPREVYRFAIDNIWELEPFKGEAPKGKEYPKLLEPDIESEEEFIKFSCLMLENGIIYSDKGKTCSEIYNEYCEGKGQECLFEIIGETKILTNKLSKYEERILNFFKYINERNLTIPNKIQKLEEILSNYFIILTPQDVILKTIELLNRRGKARLTLKQKGKAKKVRPEILTDADIVYLRSDISKLISSMKELIETDVQLISKYGYIVVFSERKQKSRHLPLIYLYDNGLCRTLEKKILDSRTIDDLVRVHNLINFLYQIYSKYYQSIVKQYKKIFDDLINFVENPSIPVDKDKVLSYSEVIEGIKSRIKVLFNRDVNIELVEYRDLVETYEGLKALIDYELTPSELEEIANSIREKYPGKEIKNSGFSFHNPKYLYSAKIWMMLNDEKIRNVIDDIVYIKDTGKIELVPNPEGPLKKLKKLGIIYRKLNELDDKINSINRLYNDVNTMLRSLCKDCKHFEVPLIRDIVYEKIDSIDTLRKLVDEIYSSIDRIITILEIMRNSLSSYQELNNELVKIITVIDENTFMISRNPRLKALSNQSEIQELLSRIDETKKSAIEKRDQILIVIKSIVDKKDLNMVMVLKQSINEYRELVNALRPYADRLSDIIYDTLVSQIENILKNLEVVISLFRILEKKQRISRPAELVPTRFELSRLKRLETVAALSDKYRKRLEHLRNSYNSILTEAEKEGKALVLNKLLDLLVSATTIIHEALKELENYATQLIRSGAIGREDFLVLKEYISLKTRVSMISFRDAVIELSRRTDLSEKQVKDSLLNLIANEFIEAFL